MNLTCEPSINEIKYTEKLFTAVENAVNANEGFSEFPAPLFSYDYSQLRKLHAGKHIQAGIALHAIHLQCVYVSVIIVALDYVLVHLNMERAISCS